MWLTALKVIPWGEVIEAAPGLVKSARKMFKRSQEAEAAAAPETESGESLQERVAQLEASVLQLAEQQQASAKLIETLAEQNARIVQVVDVLRARARLLTGASVVLAVALVSVIAWAAWR